MDLSEQLSVPNVLAFAAAELDATVGLDFTGRVFLAGGAFKSLLHGRPPRDLDLWAPTNEDRALLIERLVSRGSSRRDRHAYAEVHAVAGREIEVPDRADPPTLESRLARFDIALSAIGVELSAGNVRAVVNPLALASARRREILLLRPLVNWKHALGTLARARRYAEEVGWTVPAAEEAEVWSIFDGQGTEEQGRMLARYAQTAMPGWGVLEEAQRRMRRWDWTVDGGGPEEAATGGG